MRDQGLQLSGGAMNAQTVSDALPPGLEGAILRATNTEEATRAILANPDWVTCLRESLPRIQFLAGATSHEDIRRAYADLMLMFEARDFGGGKDGAELEEAWFEVHAKALENFPLEAIQIAVQEWLGPKGKPWFPKSNEIAKLAEEASYEIKLIAYRARKAVEAAAANAPPREKTPEEREAVRAMLADMRGPDGRIHLLKPIEQPTPIGDQHRVAANLRRIAERRA